MKRNTYTVLLCITFLLGAPVIYGKLLQEEQKTEGISGAAKGEDFFAELEHTITEMQESTEEIPYETEYESGEPENEMTIMGAEDTGTESYSFQTVDSSYFSDALFIGDSRTVGLYEYADLGGADVFADSGMSVYKIFEKTLEVPGQGKKTLENLLTERHYGKIYLMLGVNELGYDFEQTVKLYGEVLEKIHSLQPDAILFLEANLHVTEEKSASDAIYNNAGIDRMNACIESFADDRTMFYLDINEVFDDEHGNLRADLSGDQVHVYGKYYTEWAEWLCTKGIIRDKK